MRLLPFLPPDGTSDPDDLYTGFIAWAHAQGITPYPHQDEAILELLTGANAIVTTPTGSGKSLIATAAHFAAFAAGQRTYYTAPIKALVNEKFFALCEWFGAENVGMVTGDAAVGSTLVTDPRVAVVSFTGSAAVGHRIARDAAPRRVVLELGSNAALLVAADADLDRATDAVVRGGFYANGQACIAIQRIVVEESVAGRFESLLATKMAAVRVGDPRADSTRVAPLIDERSTARVLEWVGEAVQAGARVVHGGDAQGRTITPTVLAGVPADSRVWREEVFGPVVCLTTVPDFDTALKVANDSRYGLQAAVFTASLATALRAVDELDVGGVVVNEVPGFRSDIMPYGGVKDSGIGREGPRFAIEEYTVTKMALIRPA